MSGAVSKDEPSFSFVEPAIVWVGLIDLAGGCAYTLMIVVGLAFRETAFGGLVSSWIEITRDMVPSALSFLPAENSDGPVETVAANVAYRHAVVACGCWTALLIGQTRHLWSAWSRRFMSKLRGSGIPPHKWSGCIVGAYRSSMLGLCAAGFLLLFAGATSDALNGYLNENAWTLLRAPVLLAICCYFICSALMLRPLQPSDWPD